LSSFAASAIPIACDSPCPSGPDVFSIPGVCPLCGCPCSFVPSCLSVFSSFFFIIPACAIVTYCTGHMCPHDSVSLSLFGWFMFFGFMFSMLKYSAVNMSAVPSDPAECPDFALSSVFIMSSLICVALVSSFLISVVFI